MSQSRRLPRLCRERKMSYFTCNHPQSSICVQHAKNIRKNVLQMFCNIFANVLQMFYFTCNHGLTAPYKCALTRGLTNKPCTAPLIITRKDVRAQCRHYTRPSVQMPSVSGTATNNRFLGLVCSRCLSRCRLIRRP